MSYQRLVCPEHHHEQKRLWTFAMTKGLIVLTAAACFSLTMPTLAEGSEIVMLGDGSSITVDEYLLETSAQDVKTVVIKARPNFDPEPFGAVPSDNYAREMQPLCSSLVLNSRDVIKQEDVDAVRIRWDFDPTYDTGASEGVEITRFHEFLYALDEDLMCVPQPLGVGLDNLQPNLPSGLPVVLRYIEPGPRARQLTLTYDVGEPLADVSSEKLENAAIELCILHADRVLEDRSRYYDQIETELVALAFAEADGNGQELERRVLFGVRDNACNTGLSPDLTEAIRSMAAKTDDASPSEAQP